MGTDDTAEIRKLLQDPTLIDEITKSVLENPSALEDLAEDIADKLSDVLEDDPDFRAKIVQAAMGNETFKNRVVRKLAEEVADD